LGKSVSFARAAIFKQKKAKLAKAEFLRELAWPASFFRCVAPLLFFSLFSQVPPGEAAKLFRHLKADNFTVGDSEHDRKVRCRR
jgi:hypothetical protein